ncbi:MAG: plastocyanin/azurin family copper-binding protein [Verrucomicrobiota bacterium]
MSLNRLVTILIGTLAAGILLSPFVRAEDEPTKKSLTLPKSAAGAAYILGRLSNKELIDAPRGEFVYVALLQRKGLDRKYRLEALEGLAKIRKTDSLTELLASLELSDKKGDDSVLRDLSLILLQSKPEDLSVQRTALGKLSLESQLPVSRQISFAAIAIADNSIDKIWKETESNPKQRADLIRSIEVIRNATLRSEFYAKIEPLLHQKNSDEVRQAAIFAIVFVPDHDADTFNTLAEMVKSGTDRAAAIESIGKLLRKSWVKEQAESLLESLIPFLKNLPVEKRTDREGINAFQFATDLAALLPPEKSADIRKTLRSLGVSIFVVRTIPEQMLYDKTLIVVEAGKPVEIILQNDDMMPHNLVVVAPGALEEIGTLAEKMPPVADAQGRFYVPESSKVLQATKLVEPGLQAKLSFTAPEATGDYPYVCTFPGHWRRMVGTLAVVKDVESYLATNAASAAPKITEWKTDDFTADTVKAEGNPAHGKKLFTQLACVGCHKFGNEGINYGPDLTDVLKRYNSNRVEVLRQIIEPSLSITNRYRNYLFQLKNGEDISGMILNETPDVLTVQTGPSDALIQFLKKSEIKETLPQSSSLMPSGLLNSLSKQEIFDLLAWLESAENANASKHDP